MAAVLMTVAAVVFGLYGWDVLVSLAGLLPFPLPRPGDSRPRRFAVLVCAHNEERVVAGVIRDLSAQAYPRDHFEVFVVADNCSDHTEAVAAREGATVWVRSELSGRTKGYALQWGLTRVFARGGFDAICVFDADNRVPPDFLQVMSSYLAAGHVAIQAYLDTKNLEQTWVTRAIGLAYFITNRFWLRSRARLGLSATLGGTGFCLDWGLACQHRWDPGSLADDLDLTMRLIESGIRVSYCPHTRTFDEKPATWREALRQRSRWLQGHHDVAFRWTGRMLLAFLRRPLWRPSLLCFDALLHLWQPLRLLLAFSLLVGLVALAVWAPPTSDVRTAFLFTAPALAMAAGLFVVYPVMLAVLEKVPCRLLLYLPHFFLFSFTWIPATILGLWRVRRRVWTHTTHGV